jgi:hypothetical protein
VITHPFMLSYSQTRNSDLVAIAYSLALVQMSSTSQPGPVGNTTLRWYHVHGQQLNATLHDVSVHAYQLAHKHTVQLPLLAPAAASANALHTGLCCFQAWR